MPGKSVAIYFNIVGDVSIQSSVRYEQSVDGSSLSKIRYRRDVNTTNNITKPANGSSTASAQSSITSSKSNTTTPGAAGSRTPVISTPRNITVVTAVQRENRTTTTNASVVTTDKPTVKLATTDAGNRNTTEPAPPTGSPTPATDSPTSSTLANQITKVSSLVR